MLSVPAINTMSFSAREKILNEISTSIKKILGKKILSATVYGSTLCEDFCCQSDFDILLIFESLSFRDIEELKKIRQFFLDRSIRVDFNIHLSGELPKIRKGAYWHNNRSLFIQKELEMYGRQIIGQNLFVETKIYEKEMCLETVRMVNSLLYQTRKIFINGEINCENKLKVMKFCIYAVLYSLAFVGLYPESRKEAFQLFKKYYKTKIDPICFFDAKVERTNEITNIDLKNALEFLGELDSKIYKLYKKKWSSE